MSRSSAAPPGDQGPASPRLRRAELRRQALLRLQRIMELVEPERNRGASDDTRGSSAGPDQVSEAVQALVNVLDQLVFGDVFASQAGASVPARPSRVPAPRTEARSDGEPAWLPPDVSKGITVSCRASAADELLALVREAYVSRPAELPTDLTADVPAPLLTRPPCSVPLEQAANRGSLLLVEADPASRSTLARHLFQEGFAVYMAQAGRDALDTLASHPFDAVLLDADLPEMGGWDLLRVLRQRRSIVDLPVILMTSNPDPGEQRRALQAGANDCLWKSLDRETTVVRIKNQLALKRAVDLVYDIVQQLEKIQEKLEQLCRAAPGGVEDVLVWTRKLATDMASTLGLPEVGVWLLDEDHQLQLLVAREMKPPTAEEIAAMALREEPVERPGALLFPAMGFDRELFGVIVVPQKTQGLALTGPALRFVSICARQIGVALELRHLRLRLARRQETGRDGEVSCGFGSEVDLLQLCPTCGRCFDQTAARCRYDGALLDSSRCLPLNIEGRYRLLRQLGEGGMSTVFLAQDRRLGRTVAVKVIHPSLFGSDQIRQRFVRESRAMARLDHPGIVTIHDSGNVGSSSVYIVMERLRGLDLGKVLSNHGPGTPQEVAHFVRQAGSALASAHRCGLLHRDIKPDNFVLLPAEESFAVKMVDFGLAKDLAGDPTATEIEALQTRAGAMLGTPLFMAPEQVTGSRADFRCDIYSLAGVTYYALTGQLLTTSTMFMQVILEVMERVPPPPSAFLKGPVPRIVDEALISALSKKPEDRPDNLTEWINSLAEGLEQIPAEVPGWLAGNQLFSFLLEEAEVEISENE